MKRFENKSVLTIGVVVLLTIIAQFPGVSTWIKNATNENEHLVTIVEGIIGVILLIVATYKGETGVQK
jgi:hypothetical protein